MNGLTSHGVWRHYHITCYRCRCIANDTQFVSKRVRVQRMFIHASEASATVSLCDTALHQWILAKSIKKWFIVISMTCIAVSYRRGEDVLIICYIYIINMRWVTWSQFSEWTEYHLLPEDLEQYRLAVGCCCPCWLKTILLPLPECAFTSYFWCDGLILRVSHLRILWLVCQRLQLCVTIHLAD